MKQELTIDLLRELVDYNPVTGKFYSGLGRNFGKEIGSVHCRGYLRMALCGRHYLAHRLAWFYVHGQWPSEQIDHINGIKTDNRLVNLRDVTQIENLRAYHAMRRAKNEMHGIVHLSAQLNRNHPENPPAV